MRAVVYRPILGDVELEVDEEDIRKGFTHMTCPACRGTGVFQLPEDEAKCVECSGRGRVGVSL